ncbi:hypothetical protein AB4305_27450 [Nocardia sp. 2YAB30]|uniref:hypothetical protein n=1 Tax=unclassified Nocardia TaxID=2637762 RepID=UPI003F9C521B
MSLIAFAVDVGVSFAVDRVVPGPWGAVVGGAAGGAAGQWVENDFKLDGSVAYAAAHGAVGGAIGGAVAKGLGFGVGFAIKRTESELTKLAVESPALQAAKSALQKAETKATAAEEAAKKAEKAARKNTDSALQQQLDKEAKRLRGAATRAKNAAGRAKTAAQKVDDADALKNAPLKKNLESREKFLRKFEGPLKSGKGARNKADRIPGGWGTSFLRGLGSAIAVSVWPNEGNPSAGGGNDPGAGGAPTFELVWAGSHVELMGTAPFIPQLPDPSVHATGYGFLLEPSKLNATLKQWYAGPGDSVATSLCDTHQLFGDEKAITDAKQQKKALDLSAPKELSSAGVGAGVTGYADAVKALQNAAVHFNTIENNVVAKTPDVAAITKQGRKNVADLICGLNVAVTQSDGSDMSFVQLTAQAFNEIVDVTEDATGKELDIADYVKDMTTKFDDKLAAQTTAMNGTLQNALAGLQASQNNPAYTPPAVNTGDDPTNPGNIGDLENGSSQTPDPVGTNSTADNGLQRAIDTLENQAATPAVNASYPGGVNSGLGSMGGMGMGDLMGTAMQMMAMKNMTAGLDDRRSGLDPGRFDEDLINPVTPPSVTAPAPVQPATVATPASTAPTHSAAPSTPWSSQPANGVPGRTPGADGSVLYTFPDGRTQKVSAMVAQALDGAFGNASGTDAQKAYEKTPAKWSDKKQIGARVDPYQLMTGDVATWDKRSAILVVFGSEEGGTLEAVVNGALKPFVPEMSDSAGEFGQFSGFVHPKGIELAAPKDGDVPPAMPGTPDQSANAAVPIVAAPV